MRVSDVLDKKNITSELGAVEKRELLDESATSLSSSVDDLDREELLELLLEREKLGSTGIGHGVAIPHAKIKGIDGVIVSFGRSMKGLDFQSTDAGPVHLFFLIVAPDTSTVTHLKVLSGISRLLKDADFRKKLMDADGRDDIYRVIVEEERKVIRSAAV